jgi:IS30 family transposase
MGQRYSSLNIEERTQLSLLVGQGLRQYEIAQQMRRSPSTVCRELKRNRDDTANYLAANAHQTACQRRRQAKRGTRKLGTRFDTRLGTIVLGELQRALSPEQIAGRLKRMNPTDTALHISHESIYQAIYLVPRGELRTQIIDALRHNKGKRMPRARGTSRKGNIANMTPLSERPVQADSRLVPGHWEGDFIKGARNASAIGTAVERQSRYVLLTQMNGCTAQHALEGFTRRFKQVIPELRQSFTYDRGSEMAKHEQLTQATGMQVYFCEPYSPWQRGSNENMNGLVRQFLPKGMDLSTVTSQKLAYIQAALNDRPRKVLDFRTPREVYEELVAQQLALKAGAGAEEVVALQG